MTVKKVWAVYFSGTGTTKKTVDRIAHRLAEALGTDCEVYDYTLPAARRQELTIPVSYTHLTLPTNSLV